MTQTCDLCEKPVEPGQPRFGGHGNGGSSGAPLGKSRHYACHEERYGRARSLADVARQRPEHPALPPRRPVLRPKVRKGEYNRSENAARPFAALQRISEMGRARILVECPFCFDRFWAFVWSLAGGGKKCPNCGAMHASFGTAHPLVGNEDLSDA